MTLDELYKIFDDIQNVHNPRKIMFLATPNIDHGLMKILFYLHFFLHASKTWQYQQVENLLKLFYPYKKYIRGQDFSQIIKFNEGEI